MPILAVSLSTGSLVFLALALGMALAFEFVNGFHDTANAVATVIYTHSLPAWFAVIWSGCWNLVGVLTSSGAVAFGIIALLPTELVMNTGSAAAFAMIFALLISAILWNLGTWYLGLPASSSHTLIGSILGVGLGNALMNGISISQGVNWAKALETFEWLIISPIIGFVCAAILLLLAKKLIAKPALFKSPPAGESPPLWIRGLLVLTCTGVSFAHGSNDGQKGMGLLMLILIGVLPGAYALNMSRSADDLRRINSMAVAVQPKYDAQSDGSKPDATSAAVTLTGYLKGDNKSPQTYAALASLNREIIDKTSSAASLDEIPESDRKAFRNDIFLVSECTPKLLPEFKKNPDSILDRIKHTFSSGKKEKSYVDELKDTTQWVPVWVKIAIAVALGLGTMVGWKRIVKTVGEKIGKAHLTYAQGASAEIVAMFTIWLADISGKPVSTTHVLSSGIAGTMAANRSGLQSATLRNIAMAWVLTLPVCIIIGAGTFAAGLYMILHGPLSIIFTLASLSVALFLAYKVRLFSHIKKFSAAHGESKSAEPTETVSSPGSGI